MRSRLLVPALLAAIVAGPAAAYVLPTRALLDQLETRREKQTARTQRVEGTLEIYDATGARRVLPAVHEIRFPERCALKTEEPGGGAFAAWDHGRRVMPTDPALANLMVLEALACPVLAVHGGVSHELTTFLAKEGVDLDYTGLSRLDGRPAFLIGARPWEPERPQLWLDQESFLPVRMVGRVGEVTGDLRLLNYSDPATGEWHPRQMELWVDGKLKVRFTAERIEQNVTLDDGLFK